MSDGKLAGTGRAHGAVSTAQAPAAIGPYAQARRVSGGGLEWLYTSGQLGLDPGTGQLVAGGTAAEARQALANLSAVLAAAGFDFHDVVKTVIFLADMVDFQAVNEIYAEALGGALPARSTVQAAALPRGGRVEIELVAVRAGR
jgi:2-iminobutanoate/2-iminopropanoate deaminase